MFSVLVIRLRSLRLLRVSGIVMRLRMFLLLITFLKASHSFRNRLLVICKNAYLFATMIMTSVSSPFSCCSGIVRLNLQRIFLMSSLMLLLVWLIFFMVLIKLLPILGTISGKTVKLMVLALICLGNNRQD